MYSSTHIPNSDKLSALMESDVNALKSSLHPIGKHIARGSFGFVCEWEESASDAPKKVVKILDPDYLSINNPGLSPFIDDLCFSWMLGSGSEYINGHNATWTKSKYLVPMLNGSGKVYAGGKELTLIVMPYLKTLEDCPVGDDPVDQAINIIICCCEGLQLLHSRPQIINGSKVGMPAMVHGDLKPDNIFIDDTAPEAVYMIGDFSCCIMLPDDGESIDISTENISHMIPYAAGDKTVSTGMDIWSLGWILWYWLNGKKHPDISTVDLRRNGSADLDPPRLLSNEQALWKVFLRMTEPESANRYSDVKSLAAELKRIRLDRQKNSAKKSGAAGGALLTAAAIAAGAKLADKLLGKDKVRNGDIAEDIHLAETGGTFRGTWKNGAPYSGIYTSPSGIQKDGFWTVCRAQAYDVDNGCGTITFSGLALGADAGLMYQGNAVLTYKWGTKITFEVHDGSFCNGSIRFADGRCASEDFKYETVKGMSVFTTCVDGTFWASGMWPVGDHGVFCGDMQNNEMVRGELQLPGQRLKAGDKHFIFAYNNAASIPSLGCSFDGTWCNGAPYSGKFTWSDGVSLSGIYKGVFQHKLGGAGLYSGMTLDGRLYGTGMVESNELSFIAEWRSNTLCGNIHGTHRISGSELTLHAEGNDRIKGTVKFSNGDSLDHDRWNWYQSEPYDEISVLNGFFADINGKLCGVGRCTFTACKVQAEIAVINGVYIHRTFYDAKGNMLSIDKAASLIKNRCKP